MTFVKVTANELHEQCQYGLVKDHPVPIADSGLKFKHLLISKGTKNKNFLCSSIYNVIYLHNDCAQSSRWEKYQNSMYAIPKVFGRTERCKKAKGPCGRSLEWLKGLVAFQFPGYSPLVPCTRCNRLFASEPSTNVIESFRLMYSVHFICSVCVLVWM